jgi:hypothetical protein
LTYVYEVDAVDMPELESQVLPDDEPVVSVSANPEEILDDEVLPFEARPEKGESVVKGEYEVRSPEPEVKGKSEVKGESEAPSPESGAESAPKQPKLFNGNDK